MDLLKVLYEYVEETFRNFSLHCKPGCNLCCTQRIYITSIEGKYLLEALNEDLIEKLYTLERYPRPKLTHNQTVLCYLQGIEPPVEEFDVSDLCPFLDEKGLCMVYENRPLMCRITASLEPCDKQGAILPQFLFQIGLIALQIVENIDLGGVYGNYIDVLKFLNEYSKGNIEEVPEYLLSNIEVEELPILPEERDLRGWVGKLYRTPVKENMTFREIWQKLKEDFAKYKSLDFLEEIFENV